MHEIKCPGCNAPVSAEQVARLQAGEGVTCERCGLGIAGIPVGEQREGNYQAVLLFVIIVAALIAVFLIFGNA